MKLLKLSLAIAFFAVLTACQDKAKNNQTEHNASEQTDVREDPEESYTLTSATTGISYRLGEQVPNSEVCMVNNAYMGKLQMEVPFEGEMYYGCCEMCVKRIPEDPAARTALDPYSLKEIDKATAFIVLTTIEGGVAYFESEESYQEFLNSKNRS